MNIRERQSVVARKSSRERRRYRKPQMGRQQTNRYRNELNHKKKPHQKQKDK